MIPAHLKDLFQSTPPAHSEVPDSTRAPNPLSVAEFIAAQKPLLPQTPIKPAQYFEQLEQKILPGIVNIRSPRFIGHMTSPLPLVYERLNDYLVTWNQNLVKLETSGHLTSLEMQLLAELHRLFFGRSDSFYQQYALDPESSLGMVTTGGTLANIAALWVARNRAFATADDPFFVEQTGLATALKRDDDENAVIIGSELMHYSFDKAADLMGLGVRNLIKIPTDSSHRMRLKSVRDVLRTCERTRRKVIALVGIAGTTDSGAIDPLEELSQIAEEEGLWFHVDAAWGGPFIFSEKTRPLLRGVENADSITIDGHKQLYTPLGIGCLLFKDPHASLVIQKNAPYILREGAPDLGKRALEGSRPASSLYIHAAFQMIGREGYQALLEHGLANTQNYAEMIRSNPAFELLLEPVTNILLYRYIPIDLREKVSSGTLTEDDQNRISETNIQLQNQLRDLGDAFVSRTILSATPRYGRRSITSLRAILANPLTEATDLAEVLRIQMHVGDQLS